MEHSRERKQTKLERSPLKKQYFSKETLRCIRTLDAVEALKSMVGQQLNDTAIAQVWSLVDYMQPAKSDDAWYLLLDSRGRTVSELQVTKLEDLLNSEDL